MQKVHVLCGSFGIGVRIKLKVFAAPGTAFRVRKNTKNIIFLESMENEVNPRIV